MTHLTKFCCMVWVVKRWPRTSLNLTCVNDEADGPTRPGAVTLPSPGVATVLVGICLRCAGKKYNGENLFLHDAVTAAVPIMSAHLCASTGLVPGVLWIGKPLPLQRLLSSGLPLPRLIVPGALDALQRLRGTLSLTLIPSLLPAAPQHQLM